jgi:prolyl-tRNA editing enzyme YbaK/EbsC (Cys-tRNA(Pro) deacylase)
MLHPPVEAALVELGIDYEVLACDPNLADTAAFCDSYGVSPQDSANTILVASKKPDGLVAACVVLATTRLDVNHRTRQVPAVKKVSFAPAEATTDLTGMMIGGVTPFGLPATMRVLVDSLVFSRPRIVLGGGNRSSKISIVPAALQALPTVEIVEALAT